MYLDDVRPALARPRKATPNQAYHNLAAEQRGRKPSATNKNGASRNELAMRSVSPRPVVVRIHHTWSITPGMSFSVAQDIDNRVWIVETCPAGTQFWTISQAAMLTGGEKTGDPLEAAISLGRTLQARLAARPMHRKPAQRFGLPALKSSSRSADRSRTSSLVGEGSRNRELVGV